MDIDPELRDCRYCERNHHFGTYVKASLGYQPGITNQIRVTSLEAIAT